MRRALNVLAVATACLALQPRLPALVESLTDRDVGRALATANGSETSRAGYHAAYILPVSDPTVERLEVITEFRRFVLAAEEQLRAGNWMVARGGHDRNGRTLKELLQPSSGRLSIRAWLRFHPQNTYVFAPPVDVLLGEPTLTAIDTSRTTNVTPTEKNDSTSKPVIVGAIVETAFAAADAGNRTLPVRVLLDGKELIRASVDFSRLD